MLGSPFKDEISIGFYYLNLINIWYRKLHIISEGLFSPCHAKANENTRFGGGSSGGDGGSDSGGD